MKYKNKTPYAVVCGVHGKIYLKEKEYKDQMRRPNQHWFCPDCGDEAYWDDDNYEEYLYKLESRS